jgi:hypothetical protein
MNISFKVVDVSHLESRLHTVEPEIVHKNEFHFEIRLTSNAVPEPKVLTIQTYVRVMDKPEGQELGFFKSGVTYVIENFSEVISFGTDSRKFDMQKELHEILVSIAISTTRGMMAEHFRGTDLHRAFLPVLDPKSFVSEPSA